MTQAKHVVAAYVTGHGYGHYTRSAAVLERLQGRAEIHLRTQAQGLVLAQKARFAASVTEVDVGPGTSQKGPLAVDVAQTRRALAAHLAGFDARVEQEAQALRALGATLVFGDIPPLAFAAARAAKLPSVAMGNFSWSWIYAGYAAEDPWFTQAAERLAAAEAQASLCLALEMGGGLDVFAQRREIAPVGRTSRFPRAVVRERLGLDQRDRWPLVLVSFGGFGGELLLDAATQQSSDLRWLVVSAAVTGRAENLRPIEPDDELGHPELIAASDCVLGKLGYGTVVECLRSQTPLVYVPRGDFREAPALQAAVQRYLGSAELSPEDFAAGRWQAAVHTALASKPSAPPPSGDGAAQAAAILCQLLV